MPPTVHIGLVFNYDLAYARGVLRGIKQFAQTMPHWILVPIDSEGTTLRGLNAVRPSGVIAAVTDRRLRDVLKSLRRPVVNVASVLPDVRLPRVGVDHRLVGQLAATHLRDRGFRHFGFVGHPRHVYSLEREAGFRQALESQRIAVDSYYERPARSYRQRGRLMVLNTRLQHWLAALPKPVGVFACHDVWGLQVVEACRVAGQRVPEDVAVVGVDNDDLLCELARPSLSSIIVPAERIGCEAAALLARLLAKSQRTPRQPLLIPPAGVVTRHSSDVLAVDDPDVTAAVRYIREHRHTVLQVDDVLRQVPVSRRGLERRFRAILGRGLGEEIRRVHLERAKDLLATTTLSVAEVAQQAGFSSVHYLSRVFRQETGQTPSAYRRRLRG